MVVRSIAGTYVDRVAINSINGVPVLLMHLWGRGVHGAYIINVSCVTSGQIINEEICFGEGKGIKVAVINVAVAVTVAVTQELASLSSSSLDGWAVVAGA